MFVFRDVPRLSFFYVTPSFDAAWLVADPEDLEASDAYKGAGWSSAASSGYALKAHCRENGASLQICSLFLGLPGKPFTLIT